jgi:hypothetical protein
MDNIENTVEHRELTLEEVLAQTDRKIDDTEVVGFVQDEDAIDPVVV